MTINDDEIEAKILELLSRRAPGATICPSEAARALDPAAWRALMPRVRAAAAQLSARGEVVVTQRGQPLAFDTPWRGPVRIGPRR